MDFVITQPIEPHWESMAHTCTTDFNDANIDIHLTRGSKHTI